MVRALMDGASTGPDPGDGDQEQDVPGEAGFPASQSEFQKDVIKDVPDPEGVNENTEALQSCFSWQVIPMPASITSGREFPVNFGDGISFPTSFSAGKQIPPGNNISLR